MDVTLGLIGQIRGWMNQELIHYMWPFQYSLQRLLLLWPRGLSTECVWQPGKSYFLQMCKLIILVWIEGWLENKVKILRRQTTLNERWRNRFNSKESERKENCFYNMDQIVLLSVRYSLISCSYYKCETPYKFISRFQTCTQLGLTLAIFLEEHVYIHFLSWRP